MMKLRKHALSFALVALLAVGGAACGGDEGTGDTGDTATEPAGGGEAEMTEPAGGGDTMTEDTGMMTEPGEMATP
jgi:hypothetical protein